LQEHAAEKRGFAVPGEPLMMSASEDRHHAGAAKLQCETDVPNTDASSTADSSPETSDPEGSPEMSDLDGQDDTELENMVRVMVECRENGGGASSVLMSASLSKETSIAALKEEIPTPPSIQLVSRLSIVGEEAHELRNDAVLADLAVGCTLALTVSFVHIGCTKRHWLGSGAGCCTKKCKQQWVDRATGQVHTCLFCHRPECIGNRNKVFDKVEGIWKWKRNGRATTASK
jgi:hypothetical protein